MNCTDIRHLLQDPDTENAFVEFKSFAFLEGDEHHLKLCNEITGIANSGGGVLLIGITPEKKFEGKDIISNPDDTKGLISNLLRDKVSPQINCQVAFIPCPEGDVIGIKIPPKGDIPYAVVKRKGHEIELRSHYIRNDHGLQLVDDAALAGLYREPSMKKNTAIDSNEKDREPKQITVNFSPKITVETPESHERKRQRNVRIIEAGILIAFSVAIYESTLYHIIPWLSILWTVAEVVCFILSIYIFTQASGFQKNVNYIIDLLVSLLPVAWGIMVISPDLLLIGWISIGCFWSLFNLKFSNQIPIPRRNGIAQLFLVIYAVILVVSSFLIQDSLLLLISGVVALLIGGGFFIRYGIPYMLIPAGTFLLKKIDRGVILIRIHYLQEKIVKLQEEHHIRFIFSKEYLKAQVKLDKLKDKLEKS